MPIPAHLRHSGGSRNPEGRTGGRDPPLAEEMSVGQRGHHVIPAKAGIHVGATLVVAHSFLSPSPMGN